ncbi:SDR family NAD(P)-dependent oxidoreductase [Vallitalea maricola]|uniref:SDR family NAD(P)-dependent oxidoreductase n=1 Tax=Vallitalea maricola TaxID=3074433 RepID=A0ACB5UFD1_9FIRM|nr:SDR family NAD(P)-dependent oxidoreductase [Vallitalea sp. AN17-2]
MNKEVILITGATDGIGFELAKKLSNSSKKILLHGRNIEKCERAIEKIKSSTGNDNLIPLPFDLESIDEIHKGVTEIAKKHTDLKVIINNAGIFTKKYDITKDNIEKMFMVNHFSQFILIKEVLKIEELDLKRIVNTGSLAHLHVKFDISHIVDSANFNPYKVYGASKLYCLMHAYLLSEKLRNRGILVNCYDPEFINTKLSREGWEIPPNGTFENAINTVVSILNNNFETGKYISNEKIIDGSKCSSNVDCMQELWNYDCLLYERKINERK